MAAVGGARAADRIRQRANPADVVLTTTDGKGGPPLTVGLRPLRHRCPVEQVGHVTLDVVELVLLQDAFEDVEADTLVGLDDGGIEPALLVEADRASVAERARPALTLLPVLQHRRFVVPVVDDRHVQQRQLPHGATLRRGAVSLIAWRAAAPAPPPGGCRRPASPARWRRGGRRSSPRCTGAPRSRRW